MINRRNVCSDVKSAYRADRDSLSTVLKSRVIAAAMNVLGLENKTGKPSKFVLPPNIENLQKSKKLELLHELAGKVLDGFIFQDSSNLVDRILTAEEKEQLLQQQELTDDNKFPCRFPGCNKKYIYKKRRNTHELSHDPPFVADEPPVELTTAMPSPPLDKQQNGDDVYNYNCALMTDAMLFFNFLDAIKEGDGARVMRQYKYFLLFCRADESHSTKCALEILYQFFLVHALLSKRDRERFIWNRFVNNHSVQGGNIPLDEDMEHSNNFVKQGIRNLGPNLTESAISRVCKAENATRTILDKLDGSLNRQTHTGKHPEGSPDKDIVELVNRAVDLDVFTETDGRHYQTFNDFKRDRLEDLDLSSLYKWINKHKRNIQLGSRAR